MDMDTQIPLSVRHKRRRLRFIRIAVSSAACILLLVLLSVLLRGGIKASDITVSQAATGSIEISVSSFGKVKPLMEEVITSPVSSKILEVYRKAGDVLEKGDTILRLDLDAANTEYRRLQDELEMKRSQMLKMEVNALTQLSEMEMQINVDSLTLQRAAVLLRNEYYLDSIGASTSDRVRQAELDLEVQTLQYRQLRLKYANLKKNLDVDMQVAKLDYSIASKNLDMSVKTMKEAQVRAPWAGTLTWVNDQVGAGVAAGDRLATLSDLEHFKVEAEIADSYADKITSGAKAVVETGGDMLTGFIGNVAPAVEQGQIKFIITLDDDDNPVLRPGLETDIYVVNSVRDNVLTIANRSYYRGPGTYDLWVVDGNAAHKRQVILGEGSYDKVEVLNGLEEGETVIISDMSRFADRKKLRIR